MTTQKTNEEWRKIVDNQFLKPCEKIILLTQALEAKDQEHKEEIEKGIEFLEGIVNGTAFSKETGLIWKHWLEEIEAYIKLIKDNL